nr:aldehyde dehydrogenase family protein [Desulfuromonadales bacterium]
MEEIADVELGDGIFRTIDEAVAAANRAFTEYQKIGLGGRYAVVDAIRQSMLDQAERLAQMAHQETGLGRPEDKVVKNRLVTTKTPGPEDLEP